MKQLLLLLAIALSASSALAQKEIDRPLITVTGQAEIMVVPHEVAYSLRVATMEKDATLALGQISITAQVTVSFELK